METRRQGELAPTAHVTKVERKSDREVVVTRSFDAPARLVFEAWTTPELFKRWWVPKSMGMTLQSCEMDVRTGGGYRLGFGDGMAFFGRYVEVTPPSRLVWTNDESGENASVTTVTLRETDGKTLLVMSELFPSKEALDADGGGAATRRPRHSGNWTSCSSTSPRSRDRERSIASRLLVTIPGSASQLVPLRGRSHHDEAHRPAARTGTRRDRPKTSRRETLLTSEFAGYLRGNAPVRSGRDQRAERRTARSRARGSSLRRGRRPVHPAMASELHQLR